MYVEAENTHRRGKDQCMSGLQFNWIGFDQRNNMLLLLCSKQMNPKQ